MDTLRVKFTHYTKVRERSPYTVYEIAVQSPSTISWVIYKRYKDFDKLHNSLKKSAGRLPTLPPKRLFQIMEATFVETRMAQLQEYMSKLLQLPNLMRNPTLIEFLKVPDSVRPMLLSDSVVNPSNAASSSQASIAGARARPSYPNKSYEERRVYELLDALQSSPNRVAALTDFENYFFRYRPRLAKDLIRKLFLGHSSSEHKSLGGLIGCCGDHEYSKVASRCALDLICRLLDIERNKDAHTFVEVFVSLKTSRLSRMNICNHVDEERGSRLGAFRLLSVLRDRMGSRSVDQILGDQRAREQFFRWAERKRGFVTPVTNKPPTALLKSIKLGDTPPKIVAREAFKSILDAAKSNGAWMAVRPILRVKPGSELKCPGLSSEKTGFGSKGGNCTSGNEEKHNSSESPPLNMLPSRSAPHPATEQPNDLSQSGSPLSKKAHCALNSAMPLSATDCNRTPQNPLFKIEYKLMGEAVLVRTQCIMEFSIDEISTLLLDLTRREQWDLKFHRGQVITQLGAKSDIVHYVFKSFSSPYKYRDFCLLRSWTELQNGGRLIAMRSVIHPRVPEQKDYSRAILYPTGYLVVPSVEPSAYPSPASSSYPSCNHHHPPPPPPRRQAPSQQSTPFRTQLFKPSQSRSLVTFVAQMDRESVLLLSPDLLGETDELLVSMLKMQKLLQADRSLKQEDSKKGLPLREIPRPEIISKKEARPDVRAIEAAAAAESN